MARAQVAVVYSEELDANYKEGAPPRKNKSMEGWSPFAKTLGEFYIEAGVERGAMGTFFDMTVQQVEDLAKQRGLNTEFHFIEPPGFFFSYGSVQHTTYVYITPLSGV